jgi:hypothetical protein
MEYICLGNLLNKLGLQINTYLRPDKNISKAYPLHLFISSYGASAKKDWNPDFKSHPGAMDLDSLNLLTA